MTGSESHPCARQLSAIFWQSTKTSGRITAWKTWVQSFTTCHNVDISMQSASVHHPSRHHLVTDCQSCHHRLEIKAQEGRVQNMRGKAPSQSRCWFCRCRCAYANFSSGIKDCDDFYTDPEAMRHYKNHAEHMLTRVNSLTGVAYANDPTIFGAQPSIVLVTDVCTTHATGCLYHAVGFVHQPCSFPCQIPSPLDCHAARDPCTSYAAFHIFTAALS